MRPALRKRPINMKTGSMTSHTRFVLYAISSLMDMIAGTVLFVAPVRAAQLGASYSLSAGTGVAWALGAAVMTFVMGRFVTPRNSGVLCVAACLAQAVCHAGLMFFTSTPESMLPFLFAIGLTHTMFYVPYPVFFKTIDAGGGRSVSSSVGVYTFAWSLGMAAGPLWSGFLFQETAGGLAGWQLCLVFTIASCLAVAWGIGHVRRRGSHTLDLAPPENDNPDFARLSWLAALCGTFAFSLVRSLFPAGAVRIGLSEDMQGGVIFTMGVCQAVSALLLTRLPFWMYRPRVLGLAGAMGVAGMLFFLAAFQGFADGGLLLAAFYLGAALFGLYSGSFFFYTTFHCLVHPSRAGFNIAVVELMHAVASVVGLLLGGALADAYGINSPYLVAAVFICLFTLLQLLFHHWDPLRQPVSEKPRNGDCVVPRNA